MPSLLEQHAKNEQLQQEVLELTKKEKEENISEKKTKKGLDVFTKILIALAMITIIGLAIFAILTIRKVDKTLDNANKVIEENKNGINSIINNANETIDKTNETIKGLNETIDDLHKTINNANDLISLTKNGPGNGKGA